MHHPEAIHKKLFAVPLSTHFQPLYPKHLALLANKTSFAPFSSENHAFLIIQQWKEKKKIFFPTYLPNQNIQSRDTENKQFF